MTHWTPNLLSSGRPRYVELADAIEADIAAGVLRPGDRLPPQRGVAKLLGVDFSTASRGYAEAVRRGHIESFVGRGTFVCAGPGPESGPEAGSETGRSAERLRDTGIARPMELGAMMNMPPEPQDNLLLERMQNGMAAVAQDLVALLRYQSVTGGPEDIALAADWFQQNGLTPPEDRLAITPGAHASLYAIFSMLCDPGQVVLCEPVTYPGLRTIAKRLGLRLVGVEEDAEGLLPEALEASIKTNWPTALYLNPTLQNPRTGTMSARRRAQIAEVLRSYDLPLVEDDAYCFVAKTPPAPISTLLPDLGWHIAGISKCLGAGLRLAYTVLPRSASKGEFAQVLRSQHVMASPLSLAVLARWIKDGTAEALQAELRKNAMQRQALATERLEGCRFSGAPEAFNIWIELPEGTSRAEVMGRMAHRLIGILPSDAFTVAGPPQEALRVCLGGPIGLERLGEDLNALRDAVLRKDWLG